MIKRNNPVSFVLLGMNGSFTFQVLNTLLQNRVKPEAIVLYGKQSGKQFDRYEIEVTSVDTVWQDKINAYKIPLLIRTTKELLDTLTQHQADTLLVACWPIIIPEKVLKLFKMGAFNIHPSLLPKFSGASPIQDQLMTKDDHYGVTLHRLNAQYDSGEIVLQREIRIPLKKDFYHIEKACAEVGGKMFIQQMNNK